jgi:hypothetical protein
MSDKRSIPALLAISGSSNSDAPLGMHVKAERYSSLPFLTTSNNKSLPEFISFEHGASRKGQTASPPMQTTTPSGHAESQQTTHQMLSHIALLADELFRASEEKVNLVQAAFDSVSRLIFSRQRMEL